MQWILAENTLLARRPWHIARLLALLLLCGLVLAGCGGTEEQAAADTTPEAAPPTDTPEESDTTPTVAETEAPVAPDELDEIDIQATDLAEVQAAAATDLAEVQAAEATDLAEVQAENEEILINTPTDTPDVSINDLDDYLNESVAVRGTVTEIISDNAFLVRDPVLLDGDEVLIVYQQADFSISEDLQLLIGGEVQEFDLPAIEAAADLDLQDERFSAYQDQLVVVADALTRTP